MNIRQILLVALLAVLAASISIAATHFDQLWLVVAGLAAAFAGGGALLHLRSAEVMREITILREHLEATRHQAAQLARHTRELRDSVVEASEINASQSAAGGARAGDFATLSALVRDIADSVAELDRRSERTEAELAARSARSTLSPPPAQARSFAPPPPEAPPARPLGGFRPELKEVADVAGFARELEPSRQIRQLVAAAIAADRFDVYLQRVVGLPQRRIRGYDVTLRPDGGDLAVANSDIRAAVDAVGHQLAFDRKLIIQAVRLARIFERREREVVLFADISQRFLMSEAAFDDVTGLLRDAPLAAQRIVLCLPQRFFNKAVAFEHEALRKLSELGFRFLMRDIENYEFDLARLSRIGVRWIRASTDSFLSTMQQNDTIMDVATADFIAMLERRKIGFIAENTSDEASVAELLDVNVAFAHGLAFAPPQAVRADVLDEQLSNPPAPPVAAPVRAVEPERRAGLRDIAKRA